MWCESEDKVNISKTGWWLKEEILAWVTSYLPSACEGENKDSVN